LADASHAIAEVSKNWKQHSEVIIDIAFGDRHVRVCCARLPSDR
jgi:hypothetical protein